MGFRQPDVPNLLPLLLQHTLNQRAEAEARAFREDQIARQRGESALDVAVRAMEQGTSADEAISLAGPDFPADRIKGLKGIERARKQQQKMAQEQSRIGPAAEGLASTMGAIQSGAADPRSLTTLLESLQGAFSPESIGAISAEGQARLASDQAGIRQGRPVPFYENATGSFAGQARPGTPEYERLASRGGLISYDPQGTPEQVFGQFPQDKIVTRKAREELGNTLGSLRQTSEMIRTIKRSDARMFGARGAAADIAGALLAQLNPTDPQLADQVVQSIAGSSRAELQSLRTQATVAVASAIQTFSGERSGRFTEQERQIAQDAQRLMGPASTQETALEAQELVWIMHQANAQLIPMRAGIKPQYDLFRFNKQGELVSNEKALNKLLDAADREGLSKENQIRLARMLQEQQRNMMESGLYGR